MTELLLVLSRDGGGVDSRDRFCVAPQTQTQAQAQAQAYAQPRFDHLIRMPL